MPTTANPTTVLSAQPPLQRVARTLIAAIVLGCSAGGALAASGCKDALARLAVCTAANAFAIDTISRRHLEAVSVMQDVVTGALVVFAASQPSTLDVSTQVLPLSLVQVFSLGLLVG